MDINPIIADMKKYNEELIDSIQIVVGFNELHKTDRYVAHDAVFFCINFADSWTVKECICAYKKH
jgi:hypothetical protein